MNARDLHGMLLGAANTMKLHNYQYKTPEGVTSTATANINTDININQERLKFDEYVTQYEQENEVSLVEAHDSIKYDFFDEIYMQNYTRTEAIEDKWFWFVFLFKYIFQFS